MFFSRRKFEADMSDELKFHIDQYTADLIQSGVPRPEAERRARVEFGGVVTVQEECREARGLYWLDELSRQIRYALRLLRKTPVFTMTALATLAICLGANLAIFAVIDSILLRPLPFPEPDRLVSIYNTYPKANVDRDGASLPNYYERRGQIAAFSSLALHRGETSLVGEPGSTERVPGARTTPEFFDTVGVQPIQGRTYTEAETTYNTDKVVLLTNAYWQAHPHKVGEQLRVDGLAHTIIGILPSEFRFLSSPAQLYFPLSSRLSDRSPEQRHNGNSNILVARLKPGVTMAEAQAQIDAHDAALAPTYSRPKLIAEAGHRSMVVSLHGDHVAAVRPTLLLLQGGALLLLIIGVVNLVNLLLVRSSGRMKELAVRQALGAGSRHVVSEVLVETTLLTVTGGALGCLVGVLGISLLATLGADQLPLGARIVFDGRVAFVAFVAAVVIGIAMALPIAWFSLRSASLQAESRTGTAGTAAQRLRHGFIVAQTALAFVLLAGAGLLGLSLKKVLAVSPGFRQDHILTGQISLPWTQYPGGSAARHNFVANVARRLGEQPGVLAAGLTNNFPFSGRNGKSAATPKGYRLKPGESVRAHYSYGVAGQYFQAIGVPLRAGRFLAPEEPERVCVIDEDFARFYWPDGNVLGQMLYMGTDSSPSAKLYRVVGVVGRVKQAGLADDVAQGAVYYPYVYREDNDLYLIARTGTQPDAMALTMQRAVRSLDRDLPVTKIRTMEALIDESLMTRRSPALLAALFSAIALLLTAIGTYGVLSYVVAQRRREIAVRMALGARPDQIRSQFLKMALRLLAGGTLLGAAGAWVTGRSMEALLYQVSGTNWTILSGAAVAMTVVSLVACLLPAYRAARTPPMEALAE